MSNSFTQSAAAYGLALAIGVSGCGDAATFSPAVDAGRRDSAVETDSAVLTDSSAGVDGASDAAVALRSCPGVRDCFALTPVETGLSAAGQNADVDQYALRPSAPTRGELLVFLNGSGGSPAGGARAGPDNFYTVAREEGLNVIGLSYRSDVAVGRLCPARLSTRDDCYEPTRLTLLNGVAQAGAASALDDITPDEGVYARLAAALRTLAAADPAGGWDAFIDLAVTDAEAAIRWDRVIVSGHSQGGGHAALIGKLHRVARVVMLASPCDAVAGAPATWLTRSAEFRTDAADFFALGAATDRVTCPAQFDAWTALEMLTPAGDGAAIVCAGASAHAAPLVCPENASGWRAMLR